MRPGYIDVTHVRYDISSPLANSTLIGIVHYISVVYEGVLRKFDHGGFYELDWSNDTRHMVPHLIVGMSLSGRFFTKKGVRVRNVWLNDLKSSFSLSKYATCSQAVIETNHDRFGFKLLRISIIGDGNNFYIDNFNINRYFWDNVVTEFGTERFVIRRILRKANIPSDYLTGLNIPSLSSVLDNEIKKVDEIIVDELMTLNIEYR